MKSKLFLSLFGLLMLVFLVITGCGSTATSVLYDTPNWMPDGRIICNKLVVTTSQQFYGGGVTDSHGYIAAFWPSGTGEVNLFEANGLPTCSPTGELIAFFGNDGIIISDYSGHKTTVPNTSNVRYLDWSPDATKLAYSDTSRDLYVINRDGTGKTKISTSAEAVAWRVGEKIAYEFTESGYNYLGRINSDGSSREGFGDLSVYSPQISSLNSDYIYGKAASAYRKLDVSGAAPTEEVLIPSFDFYIPRLSFDNSKLVSGAYGDSGIWLINIDGTGAVKIR